MPRFLTPDTYEIEGWEFPQHLSLLKYEQDWLIARHKKSNDKAIGLLDIANTIAADEGIDLEQALELINTDRAKLLPYAAKLKELEDGGQSPDDTVLMLLRSRLTADRLEEYRADLNGAFGIDITEEDIAALRAIRQTHRLKSEETEAIAQTIIDALPVSTVLKFAEFVQMEQEGVRTPQELPELEESEGEVAADPKPPEPDLLKLDGSSKSQKKASKKAGTGFEHSA